MTKLISISDLDLRAVTGGYGQVTPDGKHFIKPNPGQTPTPPARPKDPTSVIREPAPIGNGTTGGTAPRLW
jgi:hypothetical protein